MDVPAGELIRPPICSRMTDTLLCQSPQWSICWDLSVILGPAMGAVLADPAKQYPSIGFFQTTFFRTYPYFLPCGVAAGLAFAASLMVLFCFNEVRTELTGQRRTN